MEQKIDIAIIGECLIELSTNGSLADTSTLTVHSTLGATIRFQLRYLLSRL